MHLLVPGTRQLASSGAEPPPGWAGKAFPGISLLPATHNRSLWHRSARNKHGQHALHYAPDKALRNTTVPSRRRSPWGVPPRRARRSIECVTKFAWHRTHQRPCLSSSPASSVACRLRSTKRDPTPHPRLPTARPSFGAWFPTAFGLKSHSPRARKVGGFLIGRLGRF